MIRQLLSQSVYYRLSRFVRASQLFSKLVQLWPLSLCHATIAMALCDREQEARTGLAGFSLNFKVDSLDEEMGSLAAGC